MLNTYNLRIDVVFLFFGLLNLLFVFCSGTEKEIKATMRTIQDERLQRRQSLRDQVTNQQRQSNVVAARYSNRRGSSSSSSSFGWPASPAQQPSLAARFFGTSNANTTAGTTGDEFDSGDRIPVVQESRLASSAQASLDLTTSEEVTTTSPLPSAAVDTWAHAVRLLTLGELI